MTTSKSALAPLAIAALSFELTLADGQPPKEFRLFPAGRFRAADGSGRPALPAEGWLMNASSAQRLITAAQARQNDYLLDYEHATLTAAKAGQKAIAAGWFKRLEWREGDGLYVVAPLFTAAAAQHIADLEYRYLSPVFSWDRNTGEVLAFFHAALTNDPGLDGLTDFSALGALPPESTFLKEPRMKTLLAALGLAETASEAEGLAALNAIKAQHDTSIAALRAQSPDPARFVPVATLSALQGEKAELEGRLATLSAEVSGSKLDALIESGKAAGKITPALEPWAREHGKTNLASLSAWIDAAPVAVRPGETQTGGKSTESSGSLSAVELAVCSATGVSPEDFLKNKTA